MNAQAELLVDARNGVGESPVWDALRQRLFWVDIPGRALWCWNADTGRARQWPTPEMTGCIALAAGSEFVGNVEFTVGTEIASSPPGRASLEAGASRPETSPPSVPITGYRVLAFYP